MLTTLANAFMTATRMDGLATAAPATPAGRTSRRAPTRRATPAARLAAFLRRLAG